MPPSVSAEPGVAIVNGTAAAPETDGTIAKRAHYAPPWADVSIIGIAGSSGSGKSTLSHAIVSQLNLPWVVILSIVSRQGGEMRWGPQRVRPDIDLSLLLSV
jgi:uridine kinase